MAWRVWIGSKTWVHFLATKRDESKARFKVKNWGSLISSDDKLAPDLNVVLGGLGPREDLWSRGRSVVEDSEEIVLVHSRVSLAQIDLLNS